MFKTMFKLMVPVHLVSFFYIFVATGSCTEPTEPDRKSDAGTALRIELTFQNKVAVQSEMQPSKSVEESDIPASLRPHSPT